MNKEEFLTELKDRLTGLPPEDLEERIAFYGEMIDDRVEEGASEEEAVGGIGPVDAVVSQVLAETSLTKLVKERIKPKRRLRAWEIALIVLGSPLWVSLLIAAFAVVLAVYAALWALMIALWAVELSLFACALAGCALAILFFSTGDFSPALFILGVGFSCAGLSVFLFAGCLKLSKMLCKLAKKIFPGIKSLFIKKESAA